MNNLYFACLDCKVYVDAGYKWALWSLEEPGIVERGQSVSVDAVLSAREYWTPLKTESADWLYAEVLPSVHRLLEEHRYHRIVFGTTEDFLSRDGDGLLDWMQVGFSPQLLPRYFVERLGFRTWDQVCTFVEGQHNAPWWWMLDWDNLHDKVRRKFHDLVASTPKCSRSNACKQRGH